MSMVSLLLVCFCEYLLFKSPLVTFGELTAVKKSSCGQQRYQHIYQWEMLKTECRCLISLSSNEIGTLLTSLTPALDYSLIS